MVLDTTPSAILRPHQPAEDHVAVGVVEPEPLIAREEVVAMLFNIADIAAEAWLIRHLLEDDGDEKEE